MSLYNAELGLGSTDAYAVSGIAIVGTLAPGQTATFTKVTKAITFNASTDNIGEAWMDISFDGGTTSYVFGLRADTNASGSNHHRVEVKCTSFMNVNTSNRNVPINFIAELTDIDAGRCPDWDFNDYCTITG